MSIHLKNNQEMDEEFQKRNTDCVYFLASPLTCKKGSECEFRHSEMARLNPRDCWYWLSGSCLNPSCAFRHPPLDGGHLETSSETAPNVSAIPANKINAPCYYFYNGFCNKGDLCTFLHGPIPINNVPAQKSSNPPPMEKKVSAPQVMPSPPKFVKQSASPNPPRSPYKDAVAGSLPRSPHVSSPGFDVLVDNGSEEVVYEDDYNYVVDHDGESGEFVRDGYDFKENGRDDSRIFYEKERRDYDYHFGGLSLDRVKDDPPSSRRSVLDRVVPKQSYNGHHGIDLRDRLKRRRMNDEHHARRSMEVDNLRSHRRSSFDRSRIQEKPQLSSKVSRNSVVRKRGYDVESTVFRPPKTLSQIKDEKRTRGSRETSLLTSLDGLPEDNFAAPKTLSEILEEKRRSGSLVNGNGDTS